MLASTSDDRHEGDASEAEKHHRPSTRFRNCRYGRKYRKSVLKSVQGVILKLRRPKVEATRRQPIDYNSRRKLGNY